MPVAESLELRTASGIDHLAPIGPSWRGATYRSLEHPACYRLLTPQQAPLELRATLQSWIDRPRRSGIAPVVAAAQAEGQGVFFVRYEIGVDCTLADALSDGDVAVRLASAAAAVRALPAWWRGLGQGVMPTASDVVFSAGVAHLLPLPPAALPSVETALADPGLASIVAPELMRGAAPPSPDAFDRYALGALLLRVFLKMPVDEPGEILLRAANGTLFDASRLETALPFWLARTEPARSALAAAQSLANPDPAERLAIDLGALAEQFVRLAERMDPVALAAELRAAGRSEEAMNLLGDVLLDRTSYELLIAYGETAMALGRPLEGLDSLERAVSSRPDRPDAYEAQLRAIRQIELDPPRREEMPAGGTRRGVEDRIDMIAWRNFHRLTPDRQQAHEDTIARYLLNRRQYQPAATFIYPRLFRGREFLGGKLAMNLAYCEALAGLGDDAGAARHITFMKDQVVAAKLSGALPEDQAREYKARLLELEAALAGRRTQAPPRPGSGGTR